MSDSRERSAAEVAIVICAGGSAARCRRVISTLPINAIAGIEWEPGLPGAWQQPNAETVASQGIKVCERPEQHLANLRGDHRHAEISHQALVFDRQLGHGLFVPASTARGVASLDRKSQTAPTAHTQHSG